MFFDDFLDRGETQAGASSFGRKERGKKTKGENKGVRHHCFIRGACIPVLSLSVVDKPLILQ